MLYPCAPVPAFPQDQSEPIEARRLDIDGAAFAYLEACLIWADPATTCGLPATVAPIDRSAEGLPIGVQIIGPYLEDLTTITLRGAPGARVRRLRPSPADVAMTGSAIVNASRSGRWYWANTKLCAISNPKSSAQLRNR